MRIQSTNKLCRFSNFAKHSENKMNETLEIESQLRRELFENFRFELHRLLFSAAKPSNHVSLQITQDTYF